MSDKFNSRIPRYNDDSDYTTNAPSYYDDLARKNALLKKLSERIWEYDERLKDKFDELDNVLQSYLDKWDHRIDNLDKEVEHIFIEWLNDGTLEYIINHKVLGNKADKVDVELIEDRIKFTPNAENPLYIPCSTESEHSVWDQTTHPDVKFFPTGWNGYKYWLVHTPYPYTNDFYENPEIVVSNDGVNWVVPDGLTNPIDSVTETQSNNGEHHSDAVLVMNSNTGTLECWYRWTNKNTGVDRFYRMVSTDGVKWGNKELVYSPSTQSLSPTVIYEDGKYKMWIVQNGSIRYMECESTNIGNWSTPETVDFNTLAGEKSATLWHIHIFKENNSLYHLLMAEKTGSIYYARSTDGKSFTGAVEIISPSGNATASWDNRHLYRASMIKDQGRYRVYYGGYGNSPGRWRVGLTEGTSPYTLNGSNNKQDNAYNYVDRIYGNTSNFRTSTINNMTIQKGENEDGNLKFINPGVSGVNLQSSDRLNTLEIRADNPENMGNIALSNLFVSELKALNQFIYLMGEVRLYNDTVTGVPPSLELLNRGVGGVTLKPLSNNRLQILDDSKEGNATILAENIVLTGDKDSIAINGGISLYKPWNKLRVFVDGGWDNLNTFNKVPPTSPTSPGRTGDYAMDSNYFYYCHVSNNWSRIAKDTW